MCKCKKQWGVYSGGSMSNKLQPWQVFDDKSTAKAFAKFKHKESGLMQINYWVGEYSGLPQTLLGRN